MKSLSIALAFAIGGLCHSCSVEPETAGNETSAPASSEREVQVVKASASKASSSSTASSATKDRKEKQDSQSKDDDQPGEAEPSPDPSSSPEPSATPSPPPAPTPTPAMANIIEVRIAAGTGNGSWNTAATPITASVGQTIRFINDDTIPHRLHTNGSPCAHGVQFAPGQTYDCVATRAFTGQLYDHNAGVGAAVYFDVKAAAPPAAARSVSTAPSPTPQKLTEEEKHCH